MKVLFLIDTLEVGGAEKSLLDILPRFKAVEPLLCHLYPGASLKPAFQDAGVEVVSLDLPGKYSLLRAIAAVRGLIRDHRPAVVHASLMRSSIVGRLAAKLEGVPVVNSLVSEPYARIREDKMAPVRRLKHRAMYAIDRLTAPLVTRFAANSAAVMRANCAALGIDSSRVEVIYRGRDVAAFTPRNPGTPDRVFERPTLLNVGRLLTNKGQDDLVRAMPTVVSKHPDAVLRIAGDGPFRPRLEQLIADLGLTQHVVLLGVRSDVPQLLQQADLFVSPSHYEGLPGAVVEAMLAHVPVVLSDIEVHREMVTDGRTGRLTPVQDPLALAEAIVDLIDHPERRHRMSSAARHTAIELFDIARVVRQHEALYQKVANLTVAT